jgi:hypothetical protein
MPGDGGKRLGGEGAGVGCAGAEIAKRVSSSPNAAVFVSEVPGFRFTVFISASSLINGINPSPDTIWTRPPVIYSAAGS